MNIFTLLFYQPIFNALVYLYNVLPGPDIGLAIIALTILIKVILWPLTAKMLKSQKALQDLQPKLQALQKKHKGDREALGRATMELYKREKINPLSSCLPLLVQLPFLFAVFRVFRDGLKVETLELLYPFVSNPGAIDPISFNFINLAESNIVLAFLTGAAQFWQTRMLTHNRQPNVPGAKDEGMATMMNRQMAYVLPVVTIVIGATLPGGLVFYWFLFTLITIAQQKLLFRKKPHTRPAQEVLPKVEENEDNSNDKDQSSLRRHSGFGASVTKDKSNPKSQ